MDREVIHTLEEAGVDVTMTKWIPHVGIEIDPEGNNRIQKIEKYALVVSGDKYVPVRLKSIPELFTGNTIPPSFVDGPTDEYMLFFCMIELTAFEAAVISDSIPTDSEFEELYALLKRRPNGNHSNPIFSYMQAAARLYMSLRDVSRAEFEAVANCLSRFARHFAEHAGSRNYYNSLSRALGRWVSVEGLKTPRDVSADF